MKILCTAIILLGILVTAFSMPRPIYEDDVREFWPANVIDDHDMGEWHKEPNLRLMQRGKFSDFFFRK